ncbi:hypothetical protein GQ53DRAFT_661454 [Thozetella sp. PMI_491]|nr:hypothetical protein GQ53DRAFT_661454 [Thozetella sp. PMI_491]
MSAAATQHPVIPPRPSRATEKATMPVIPPRPIKGQVERSVSPNPDRFAPSPLNDLVPFASKSPRSSRLSVHSIGEPLERSTSVDLPSVGQEGIEYEGIGEEQNPSRSNSPEQTRTVAADLKLHAPKPSLPASSAKQRVIAVTRTDSDKAASFGIGKPSSSDGLSGPPYGNMKKKGSTNSQVSNGDSHDEEHGIPEIGQQVPMLPHAGDVQAPSPAPQEPKKHHTRKTSARGLLPPGSYGLHGHGVVSQDKLEKAYYEKHPDLLKKEHTPHHHDRPYDYSMSSDALNNIVRETARSTGLDVHFAGTPSEQVGWQALEESTSRVASPHIGAADSKSPLKATFKSGSPESQRDVIHVDEPSSRRKSVMFSEDDQTEDESDYRAPILAEDEVEKNPPAYEQPPAVELPLERRGSASDEPSSRPNSRPASLYKEASFEHQSTPLEDVEEYEPLFPEDEKSGASGKPKADDAKGEQKQRFPSRDIWEDAPSSVHYTAEVSTPEVPTGEGSEEASQFAPPPRSGETPAQAFARHQEELAEKESQERGPDGFLPGHIKQRPVWMQNKQHLASQTVSDRPSMGQRFPSRDVWEDTPDSLKLETIVSTPETSEEPRADAKPEMPQRPQRKQSSEPSATASEIQKPAMPDRPKPKYAAGDDASKPVVPERPKPQIPARPAKAGPTSGGLEPAEAAAPPRQKPAVPIRPMGSKIAALQAGFMSDLNNRLRLGPQAPKKEEPAEEEAPAEEKEKAPLSDARKGRARGPQRRAPAKSPSPAAAASAEETKSTPKFSLAIPSIVFEIDPEDGDVSVGKTDSAESAETETTAEEVKPAATSSPAVTEVPSGKEELPEVETEVETKTLAANTAGEPVVEVSLEADTKDEEVKPTAVEEH